MPTFKSVAVYTVPPMPTPPVTTKAPVVEPVDTVEPVTAKPDTESISVDGLYTKVFSIETAAPDAVPDAGVNNTLWLIFVAAETTFIFVAVVANPEVIAYPD